ncbi:MAG: hypothetical protein JO250_07300 [Armatimonadetes bacterium]|nr:hypothetical protein [Armatimonadota bacterium]
MSIVLTPETEAKLRDRARREGRDPHELADAVLADALDQEARSRAAGVPRVNVPEPALDGWRDTVERLRTLILTALSGVRTGHHGVVERRLERAQEEVTRLAVLMDRADAIRPDLLPGLDPPPRPLNTPTNRRYAEKLRATWEAALAVDRERYGDDVGTDGPALVIELMLRDVEEQLRGPSRKMRE